MRIKQNDGFERIIEFEPGHDCIRFECIHGSANCKPGAGGSHGRSSMGIRFVLIGKKGAVQFLIWTGWLPEPEPFRMEKTVPIPADLGIHAKTLLWNQQPRFDCKYIPAGCYYDGSGLRAADPFRVLLSHGEQALWSYLEAEYLYQFQGGTPPAVPQYQWPERSLETV